MAALVLGIAWAIGAAVTLWWTWQSQATGWGQAFAAVLGLATGAAAIAAWRQSPTGSIHWDGAGWTLTRTGRPAEPGRLEAGADLQWLLLVRWVPDAGRGAWLWLERNHAPHAWDALRRAVYSRARADAPHRKAQPPAPAP